MEALFFWIFAIGLVVSALMVILNRNPVACALWLATAFVNLAALFGTLEAFFLMVVQIIVYAGAVMVLFLFIIMLLDIKAEKMRPIPWIQITGVSVLAAIAAFFFKQVLGSFCKGHSVLKWGEAAWSDTAKAVGEPLFRDYTLPFLTTGVLLLIATIGVVLLSKKEAK